MDISSILPVLATLMVSIDLISLSVRSAACDMVAGGTILCSGARGLELGLEQVDEKMFSVTPQDVDVVIKEKVKGKEANAVVGMIMCHLLVRFRHPARRQSQICAALWASEKEVPGC